MEYHGIYSCFFHGIQLNIMEYIHGKRNVHMSKFIFREYHGIYSSKLGHAPGIAWKYKL